MQTQRQKQHIRTSTTKRIHTADGIYFSCNAVDSSQRLKIHRGAERWWSTSVSQTFAVTEHEQIAVEATGHHSLCRFACRFF